MSFKYTHHFIRTALAVSLWITSLSPAFAQSIPTTGSEPTGADTPAVTETVVEVTVTLDNQEVDAASTARKEAIQTTEKTIPGDSDPSQETVEKLSLFLPMISVANTSVDAASIQPVDPWSTVENETFEGAWPDAGWRTYDCNGSTGGDRFWDDESAKPGTGSWSAWAAGGGANALNPRTSFYGNNACAWMIYGPFSLASVRGNLLSSSSATFQYWNQSERNYDWLSWGVSCDGVNFSGGKTSGDSGGWRNQSLDLSRCYGDSTVWIGFRFTSDSSNTDDGPFIDNVLIKIYQAINF